MEILLAIFGVGLLASLVGGGSGGGLESEEPDLTDEGTSGPDILTGTTFCAAVRATMNCAAVRMTIYSRALRTSIFFKAMAAMIR